MPQKCSRCGSEDHLTAKFPKPPKENEKWRKQVRFNNKGNRACYSRKNNSDKKIYVYIACMSGNDECPSGNFGGSSQLTNWILDSRATCHMKPEVSDFIPCSLDDTDTHIEFADGNLVTTKQKGQVRIKMCNNNGDPFIATLHNALLALDLCYRLFAIITLMNFYILVYSTKGF